MKQAHIRAGGAGRIDGILARSVDCPGSGAGAAVAVLLPVSLLAWLDGLAFLPLYQGLLIGAAAAACQSSERLRALLWEHAGELAMTNAMMAAAGILSAVDPERSRMSDVVAMAVKVIDLGPSVVFPIGLMCWLVRPFAEGSIEGAFRAVTRSATLLMLLVLLRLLARLGGDASYGAVQDRPELVVAALVAIAFMAVAVRVSAMLHPDGGRPLQLRGAARDAASIRGFDSGRRREGSIAVPEDR